MEMRETTKYERRYNILYNLCWNIDYQDPYEMKNALIDKINDDENAELNYRLLYSYINQHTKFDTDIIELGGSAISIREYIDNIICSAFYLYYTFGTNEENETDLKECIEYHVYQHLLNLRKYLNSIGVNPILTVTERKSFSKILSKFITKVINLSKDKKGIVITLNGYIQNLSKDIQKLINDKNDANYLKVDSKFKTKKLSLEAVGYDDVFEKLSLRLKTVINNDVKYLKEKFKDFGRNGHIEISLVTRDSYSGDIYNTYDGFINYYFTDDDRCVISLNIDLEDSSLEKFANEPQLEVFAIIARNVIDEDMIDKKYKEKYEVEYAYGNLYSPLGMDIWPKNLNKLIMER